MIMYSAEKGSEHYNEREERRRKTEGRANIKANCSGLTN